MGIVWLVLIPAMTLLGPLIVWLMFGRLDKQMSATELHA
jgi:hypothetical protein